MSIPDLETYLPKVISWRRDLHMHPELGLQEVRTSNLIADLLTKFGLDVQRNFAGTAVLGTLHTNKPGKTVVLRADMDALPIQDAKDVPYRSQISGVCHACGHDAHTANLLGVANYISDHRTEFCGTIKFLFQPAEELLEGAKLVCQSGVLDGTDYILGQHAVLDVDVGQVQVCYGPSNGGGDELTLRLHGVGCHGARPHTGKDPILLAAKVIEGFQQIISRELDPLKAAVISVCSVQAGQHESKNVVPQEAVLAGTVRTLEEDVRTYVLTRMEEIVAGLCSASRCSYTLEHVTKVPPLTSDQQLTQLVENTAVELVGRENVLYRPAPTMGVEDFSWYTRNYNACMFYFGARNVEKGIITRGHNPKFDIDEECFRVAMPMFILLSKRLMLD